MAQDGLLFKVLGKINDRTKTPLLATIVSGIVAGTPYILLFALGSFGVFDLSVTCRLFLLLFIWLTDHVLILFARKFQLRHPLKRWAAS